MESSISGLLDLPFHNVGNDDGDDLWIKKNWVSKLDTSNYYTIVVMKELRKSCRHLKLRYTLQRLLYDWPSELLFEVLKYLFPLDLLHMSRTTKQLRLLLLTRKSAWIWQEAYERHSHIPPCPPDIPHPRWTELLFGTAICHDCGERSAEIDYMSRRRICHRCRGARATKIMDKYIDDESRNLIGFEKMQEMQEKLIEQTQPMHIQCFADECAGVFYFNSFDFFDILVAQYGNETLLRNTFQSFRVLEQAGGNWRASVERIRYTTDKLLHAELLIRLKRRFVRLGYEEDDINRVFLGGESASSFQYHFSYLRIDTKNPLRSIRRDWRRIVALLEPSIDKARKQRLFIIQRTISRSRKEIIHNILESQQGIFGKDLLDGLPAIDEIFHYNPFAALIDAPPEVGIDGEDIENAVQLFISKWPPKTMADLAALVPFSHLPDPSSVLWTMLDICSEILPLTCVGCASDDPGSFILGRRAAMSHKTLSQSQFCKFEVSGRGCIAAMSLLESLGLSSSALPKDLDDLKCSLLCGNCQQSDVMTWDECIEHFIAHEEFHSRPIWKLAEEVAVQKISGREHLQ